MHAAATFGVRADASARPDELPYLRSLRLQLRCHPCLHDVRGERRSVSETGVGYIDDYRSHFRSLGRFG